MEWGGTEMKLHFDDDSEVIKNLAADTFYSGFNHNLFLRESCYKCKYAGMKRVSDFTLGDYWGVNENEVDNSQLFQGVSLLLVNSDYGLKILKKLDKYLYTEVINPDNAIKNNHALVSPNERPKVRDEIFEMLKKYDYDSTIKKVLYRYYFRLKISKLSDTIFGTKNSRLIKNKVKKLLHLPSVS